MGRMAIDMFTRSILHSMNATKHMATIVYRRFHPGVVSTFAGPPEDRGSGVGMAAVLTSPRRCRQRTQWHFLLTGTNIAPGCENLDPGLRRGCCCTAQKDALGDACLACPAPRTLPIRRTRRAGIIAVVIDTGEVAEVMRDAGCQA